MNRRYSIIILCTFLFFAIDAEAALWDRGNGLVYDDALNVTWLQDANLAERETFGVTGINSSGQMDWITAISWIDAMNEAKYLGFNEWRLPRTSPINGAYYNYDWSYDGSTDQGYNISAPTSAYPGNIGSEMAHLFHNGLGNTGQRDIYGNYNPDGEWGLQNTGPFISMEAAAYWSISQYDPDNNNAWYFDFWDAYQYNQPKSNNSYRAFALLDGDMAPVPIPGTFWLFVTGLIAFAGLRKKARGPMP